MRVAVFRAADDGKRTAERLTERGHEAILAPVIEIVPTGATVPSGATGALVFTSAHAPEALTRHAHGVEHLRSLPCWCVGHRTAAAARDAGFSTIITGPGDAAGLAAALIARHDGAPITLVAGRERKPDLEDALRRHGSRLAVIEAYRAEALTAWPASNLRQLKQVEAALHYSRRSACLAADLAVKAGLESHMQQWSHHCLSADIADALRRRGLSRLTTAARPDDENLLESLPDPDASLRP